MKQQRPLIKQVTNPERLERLLKSGQIIKGSVFLTKQPGEKMTLSHRK